MTLTVALAQKLWSLFAVVSCRVAVAAITGLALTACDENGQETAQQQPISYATRAPGSTATPTNDTSFELISADGPQRLARLQSMITDADKQCNFATGGIFKGGFDGSDEWLVKCADSGNWIIWFRRGRPPEILSCSTTDCL